MTSNIKQLDPVQGLLDYVLDVKPFHTKVIEVLTEYVYNEPVSVSFAEMLTIDVDIVYPAPFEASRILELTSGVFGGGFGGSTVWDSFTAWPVIPPVLSATGPFDLTNPGYSVVDSFVLLPGDRIAQYMPGQSIVVDLYSYDTVLDTRSIGVQATYNILASEYESTGIIGGSPITPHTRLTVVALADPTSTLPALGPNEVYAAEVTLVPIAIDSVVGYSNATPIFYTDVPPGADPLPTPTPGSLPQSPDENPLALIFSNSFVALGDVSSAFTQGFNFRVTGGSTAGTYITKYAHYDSVGNKTYIRVIETIDTVTPFVTGVMSERFYGYDGGASISTSIPSTLARAQIIEHLVFSWSDPGLQDVIDGVQYFVKEATIGPSTFVLNGDASEDFIPAQVVGVIGAPTNDGVYTIVSVTVVGGFTNVVVAESVTAEQGGWMEAYTGP